MEGMRSRILNRQTITPQHQNQANLFLEQGQKEMWTVIQEMWTVQIVRKVEGGGGKRRCRLLEIGHIK